MIIEQKPITMVEVKEILKNCENERAKVVLNLIKKFSKLSSEEIKNLYTELKKLNIEKLNEENIIKILDFLPEDSEDLRKIFSGSDITLNQDEISNILKITKK